MWWRMVREDYESGNHESNDDDEDLSSTPLGEARKATNV
jgi:hypothetical protein